MERRPTLSLTEWAVLGLLVEEPRHGYEVAAELRAGSAVGEVWRVGRPLVYRAIDRLEALGLLEARRQEPGASGPPRTVHGPTRRGRAALRRWLATPVAHLRDIRDELLLKLVLADRLGVDRRPLLDAQRAALAVPLALRSPDPGVGDPVALWRHHAALAAASFLDQMAG